MFEKIIFGFIAVIAIYQGYKYLDKQQRLNEADKIVAIQQQKTDVLINKVDKFIKKRDDDIIKNRKTDKLCKSIESLARSIMQKRQEGISMSSMMEAIGKNDMHRELVKLAYKKSRYSTEEYKQKSITNFANKAASTCFNSIK